MSGLDWDMADRACRGHRRDTVKAFTNALSTRDAESHVQAVR